MSGEDETNDWECRLGEGSPPLVPSSRPGFVEDRRRENPNRVVASLDSGELHLPPRDLPLEARIWADIMTTNVTQCAFNPLDPQCAFPAHFEFAVTIWAVEVRL